MLLRTQAGVWWDPAWGLCCKNVAVEQKSKHQLTPQVKYKISVDSTPFGSFITIRFLVQSVVNSEPEILVRSRGKQQSWLTIHNQWNLRKQTEHLNNEHSLECLQEPRGFFKMRSGRSLYLPSLWSLCILPCYPLSKALLHSSVHETINSSSLNPLILGSLSATIHQAKGVL